MAVLILFAGCEFARLVLDNEAELTRRSLLEGSGRQLEGVRACSRRREHDSAHVAISATVVVRPNCHPGSAQGQECVEIRARHRNLISFAPL